jgi:hypothetical protein
LEELLKEEIRVMPEVFTLPDFERFVLKLTIHLLMGMSPILRQRYQQEAPHLLDSIEMWLELKERILRKLPASHVVLEEAKGLVLLFHGGKYHFLQPVPAPLILQAMEDAGLSGLLEG